MNETLLPMLHQLMGYLPGCGSLGISGSWIIMIVFYLNLLIFGLSFAKGKPLFVRGIKFATYPERGIMTFMVISILFEITMIGVVYHLSMRYAQLPLYFEDTMYGGPLGIFRDMEGIETPAPAFGKVCGLNLVQIISADEKEWIYLGFLVNILLTYINFFFAVVYYGYHLVRRFFWKRSEKGV